MFELGPLTINQSFIYYFISVGMGMVCLYFFLSTQKELRTKLFDTLFNSFIFAFLAWKLSPILFNPSRFISDPILLLYYPGGFYEVLLGLLTGLSYLLYKSYRLQLTKEALIYSFLSIYLVSGFVYHFLMQGTGDEVQAEWLINIGYTHHLTYVYQMIIHLFMLLWIIIGRVDISTDIWLRRGLIVLGGLKLLILLIHPVQPLPVIWILPSILFYLILLCIGIVLELISIKVRRKA
jgi:hypothetical protein